MPRKIRSSSTSSKSAKPLKQTTLLGHFVPSSSPEPLNSPKKSVRSSPARRSGRKSSNAAIPKAHAESPVDLGSFEISDSESDVQGIQFEQPSTSTIDISDDELSHNASDRANSESPKRPIRSQRSKNKTTTNSVFDTATDADESDEQLPRWLGRGGKNVSLKRIHDSDEDSDNTKRASPPKKKLVKGVRPPTPDEDLVNELDQEKVIQSRMRDRGKKSKYLETLERLKRRKRGEVTPEQQSDENQSSSSETEAESERPFAGARPTALVDDEDEEFDSDDDFIVKDDDNVPLPELPAAFSMGTHQDLSHHFKTVCQFFVHAAVKKPKARRKFIENAMKNEEYFSVPLQVMRRKLDGIRDSAVGGSTWTHEFRRALEAYPVFELYDLSFAIHGCDACHLGARLSTRGGRLSGKPYDSVTFEDLVGGDSDEEDEDSEEDAQSKAEKTHFNLGRFCAARVSAFHKFCHWEWSLFHSLMEEVEIARRGKRGGFVPVAYAGGKLPPKDLTDADTLMEWIDDRHIIELEWGKIKQMMENANHLEMRTKKGEDD